MTIDWFTIAAQALNFLLLVYLLKRFLYPSIIRAMDKREKLIASRVAAADDEMKQAKEAETSYNQLKQEFSTQQQELTAKAREDAEKLRQELSEKARAEVEDERAKWKQSLLQQEEEFLRLLRQRSAEQVMLVTRKALQDLADAQLEQQIASRFVARLKDIKDGEWKAARGSMEKDKGGVAVHSAFPLGEDMRTVIIDLVRQKLGDKTQVAFTTSDGISGGVLLKIGDMQVAWSLESYLDELQEEVSRVVQDASGQGTR
jgi:F-type H+-transporting ATPase subunit b